MAIQTLTEEQVLGLIHAGQKEMSLNSYAKELDISPAYLSDIYNKRRQPGEKILKKFGIAKTSRIVVEYTYFRK